MRRPVEWNEFVNNLDIMIKMCTANRAIINILRFRFTNEKISNTGTLQSPCPFASESRLMAFVCRTAALLLALVSRVGKFRSLSFVRFFGVDFK